VSHTPAAGELQRLFIALELPLDLLRIVEKTQSDLKRTIPPNAAKWVSPSGIHLTLKFLGDVPIRQINPIITAIQDAVRGQSAFYLSIEGLGCFPNAKNPRVLWLGLTGNVRQLATLQSSIEAHIAPMGYPTEERGFHPHLTLARAAREARREEVAALGRAAEHGIGALGSWRVDAVSLMRSQLRPEGALYTQEASIQLDR
jgi:RNA 2',3'-cyclic 3'-phosphodiesterase